MVVEIRTRGIPRTCWVSACRGGGTQLEAVPTTLVGPMKLASTELGLPVEISLPSTLKIRSREKLVDIVLVSKPE